MKNILPIIALALFACNPQPDEPSTIAEPVNDPLPSWNESVNKAAIIQYVETVTNENNQNYIPQSDRIATFDNDGCLWTEQPLYSQLFYTLDRIKYLAPTHPEWKEEEPFASILSGDLKNALAGGEEALLELVIGTHAESTTIEFSSSVTAWLDTAVHPLSKKPYTKMVYQPMLELLDYLRANGFKTFIVSGGGIDFMRPWTESIYGIPSDQVIGSSLALEFEMTEEGPQINRLPKIDFIDDKAGKPVGIQKHIGKKPVFAAGNSDGDLQMLQWTDSNDHLSFQLYIHHTDSVREVAYDGESSIGRLDKGLDEAAEKGWTVVDMAADWKTVWPE